MSPLFDLTGETAVVTGATRGIGQSIALGLAEAGADIVLIQRDDGQTATRDAIVALGRSVAIYTADLSSKADVQGLAAKVFAGEKAAGAVRPPIRILVNCAGIQRRHDARAFPDDDFDEVLQVNLGTVFTLSRDFGAAFLDLPPSPTSGRRGSIINIASLLSFQGGFRVPAYAASKGAVAQLTKSLANEWTGQGVTVNAIAPGYIATDMNEALIKDEARQRDILIRIPAGRWGRPDDFKGPSVFLASKAAEYVSGHVLVVDGGWMGR
ncbi:2-deoxy-d-gluconate 3-dehydrogenase [Grosmannia clavigera kw1407]|uniref:2-deoxy-d-gluconate 3-dehydrogenase n=1 Tax=Grosmannia clavigera (strain kw1407 / UAMH 11150) TaxID=655863 RepID=F0XBS8_GROCL|nr:2-deoxy-d-gluconate 3-dehydrogenase [Grosmannia clavigera kw1407]EFX05000.1 2-deoxy-d-gluconate 3-dehydrogenase [Grosmannia clavigera kw1407]